MSSKPSFRIFGPEGSLSATDLGDPIDVSRNSVKGLRDRIPEHNALVGVFPFDREVLGTAWIPNNLVRSSAPGAGGIALTASRIVNRREVPTREDYLAMVTEAVDRINDGQMSKVALARTLVVDHSEPIDVEHVFRQIVKAFPTAHSFLAPEGQGSIVGASPELLLRKSGSVIESFPLAGSAPRSSDPNIDAANAQRLLNSLDRQHEHQIVVEGVARALSPLTSSLDVPNKPELFKTERIWHLGTPIRGELASPELSSLDIANILHPTAAVGGEPRAESTKAIGELEQINRGSYGGFFGWMDRSGDGEWFVAIRCAYIEGKTARLFGGSGIVGQSIAEDEYQETGHRFTAFLDAVGWNGSSFRPT